MIKPILTKGWREIFYHAQCPHCLIQEIYYSIPPKSVKCVVCDKQFLIDRTAFYD